MSLKAVHLVFVTVLTALTLGCGIWFLKAYAAATEEKSNLVIGILFLVACVGVIVYGRYFLKKLKKVSYL
jgi:heme/copper-type cytochrome/quinol oxidase subunit 2